MLNIRKHFKDQNNTLGIIESLILKYRRRLEILTRKNYKLFTFFKKISYISKLFVLTDNLYLYLLRNNLYRILDKIIKDANFRKLLKDEILKAPEGSFTEFVNLFNDIKKESYKLSKIEYNA